MSKDTQIQNTKTLQDNAEVKYLKGNKGESEVKAVQSFFPFWVIILERASTHSTAWI